jgi:hypothetical protein
VPGGPGTKTRSGGDERACFARSLRAEKDSTSVAFESPFAWLVRTGLSPEPQGKGYSNHASACTPAQTVMAAIWEENAHRHMRRGPPVTRSCPGGSSSTSPPWPSDLPPEARA